MANLGELREFFKTPLFTENVARRVKAVTYDLMRTSREFLFGVKMLKAKEEESFPEEVLYLLFESIKLHMTAQVQQHFITKGFGPKVMVIRQTIDFIDPEELPDDEQAPQVNIVLEDDTKDIIYGYIERGFDAKVLFEPKTLDFLWPSPVDVTKRLAPLPLPQEAVQQ